VKNVLKQNSVTESQIVGSREGDELPVGGLRCTAFHTPGHTPGSFCLYVPHVDGGGTPPAGQIKAPDGVLVSGDTMFVGSCGRTDMPGASEDEIMKSLARLCKGGLGEKCIVLPGHNYAPVPLTTIKMESETNQMVRMGFMRHKDPGALPPIRPGLSSNPVAATDLSMVAAQAPNLFDGVMKMRSGCGCETQLAMAAAAATARVRAIHEALDRDGGKDLPWFDPTPAAQPLPIVADVKARLFTIGELVAKAARF